MSTENYNLIDILIKIVVLFGGYLAFRQYVEVKKKRHIDMYWKIADIYASEEQRNARNNILLVEEHLKGIQEKDEKEIIFIYNEDYHLSTDPEKKAIDKSIMHRLRFLNQIGVLLNNKLVNQDLLFGLIGVGFELDYNTMRIVLKAHRKQHNSPHMFGEYETVWRKYQEWKLRK